MGYRSEVAIGIRMQPDTTSGQDYLDKKNLWNTFVAECKARHPLAFDNKDLCFTIFNDKRMMGFTQYELKWYNTYPDVQAFMGVIDIAKDYNEQHKEVIFDTAYVRVGEESDDVEVDYEGEGWDMFQPYSGIGGELYDEIYLRNKKEEMK